MDIKDILFNQTGYSVPYESTHKFDVKIQLAAATSKSGSTTETKKILEGKNHKLCFDQRGAYTIVPDSCYRFGNKSTDNQQFVFDTTSKNATTLSFKPTFFKVEGKLIL